MKKNPLKNIVVAAVSALALAPFAVADLEKYLPNGETFALVKVENVAELEKKTDRNAFAVALNAKIIQPLLAEFRKEAEPDELEKVSAGLAKLTQVFRGEIVVAALNSDNTDLPVVPVILADVADGYDLEKVANLCPESGTFENLTVAGVPAKKSKGKDEEIFTVVDGMLIFTVGETSLARVLSGLYGYAQGLSASEAFKKARVRIGNADCWFYADGASTAKALYAFAEAHDRETYEKNKENPQMAMFSVLATPIVKAFAPEAIDSLWSTCTIRGNDIVSESSLSWNANKGIVTLWTNSLKDGFEKPAFFPQDAQVSGVSSSNFSSGALVLQLMNLVRTANPLFGFVDMQLMNLKATQGIDIPAALGALDNGFFSYSLGAGMPEETVFVQNVTDENLVLSTLRDSAKMLDGVSVVENMPEKAKKKSSQPIYSVFSDNEEVCAFTVIDKKLCIGPKSVLKRFIAQSKKSAGTPSVWDNVNLKAGEAMLPAGGCGISYSHVGKAIAGAFATAKDSEDEDVAEFLRAFDIREGDFDYSAISKSYLGTNELTTKSVIIKNQ